MKRLVTAAFALVLGGIIAPIISASGPLGIYGIVEKVVFEPNERVPERIQLWGAFAYAEGRSPSTVSPATRGYIYFRLPTIPPADTVRNEWAALVDTVRNEWADLKAVAGTGQAVGFGSWGYIGRFESLRPDARPTSVPYILEETAGRPLTDLRVRPASEPPATPAAYQTNFGVVKLNAGGSHAAIVKQLAAALRR
jgi:hypothetical protein